MTLPPRQVKQVLVGVRVKSPATQPLARRGLALDRNFTLMKNSRKRTEKRTAKRLARREVDGAAATRYCAHWGSCGFAGDGPPCDFTSGVVLCGGNFRTRRCSALGQERRSREAPCGAAGPQSWHASVERRAVCRHHRCPAEPHPLRLLLPACGHPIASLLALQDAPLLQHRMPGLCHPPTLRTCGLLTLFPSAAYAHDQRKDWAAVHKEECGMIQSVAPHKVHTAPLAPNGMGSCGCTV